MDTILAPPSVSSLFNLKSTLQQQQQQNHPRLTFPISRPICCNLKKYYFSALPTNNTNWFSLVDHGPPKESYVVGVFSRVTRSDLEYRKNLAINFVTLTFLSYKTTTGGRIRVIVGASNEDTQTELSVAAESNNRIDEDEDEEDDDEDEEPDPQDLEYVSQIKRVLELLKKNRDMLFSEVKLTVMIEDPREVERRRLLGIDDADAPTREDLAAVLEEVNEGKIPRYRAALQMLAEEMVNWPNLEVEATKKGPRKSLYAKATDTGVDPEVAAKRLNIDWDSAAEIEEVDGSDETEVPSAVGYGALYLVTAFPVIIGISVVLILFYNSLQ